MQQLVDQPVKSNLQLCFHLWIGVITKLVQQPQQFLAFRLFSLFLLLPNPGAG